MKEDVAYHNRISNWSYTTLDSLSANGLFSEIRCTPPKEDTKKLPIFFTGNSQKSITFFGRKGKEGMGIPKISNGFGTKQKLEFPDFLLFWLQKSRNFQFILQFLEFPFF